MAVDMAGFEKLKEELGVGDASASSFLYYLATDGLYYLGGINLPKYALEAKLKEYEYKQIEIDGGGEGGTEAVCAVFAFMGKLYQIEYSYYSYDGDNYDYCDETLCEVIPKEVVVTKYVKV